MFRRICWVVLLLAAVIAFAVALERNQIESDNNVVQLVVDYGAVQELASVSNQDSGVILEHLRGLGIGHVALPQRSLGEYLMAGKEIPYSVRHYWEENYSKRESLYWDFVGFWEEDIAHLKSLELSIVPRVANPKWGGLDVWSQIPEMSPKLIIFSGVEVSGHPDSLGVTAENIEQLGSKVGLIEFTNQAGITQVAPIDSFVRVHGITQREMAVLPVDRIISRYVRAVRERNIRVLYIRPFLTGDTPLEDSLAMLSELSQSLQNSGYQIGAAVPIRAWSVSNIIVLLISCGVIAASLLFLDSWVTLPTWLWAGAALLMLLLSGFAFQIRPLMARQFMALVAAIVFPSLGLVSRTRARSPVMQYCLVSATSLLGAVLVVGLLSSTEFMVKLVEFRGVKLMHIGPLGIMVLYSLLYTELPVEIHKLWKICKEKLNALWNSSLPIKFMAVTGILAAVGFVYLRRTGNFGLPITNLEIAVREWLEAVLVARPRTKEFLIGHPALLLACILMAKEEKHWVWLTPLAVVGQLSIVNTFTHIHTPLVISLLRTFWGLVFGLLIGLIAAKLYALGKEWLSNDSGFRVSRIRKSR